MDGFKAANSPPDNPDTSGTKGRAGKNLTLEQIRAMTASEWLSQDDHESRTKMLEDAHIRAARGGGVFSQRHLSQRGSGTWRTAKLATSRLHCQYFKNTSRAQRKDTADAEPKLAAPGKAPKV